MSWWFEELNEKQKEAVSHPGGPLFVVAGAGTGKTKTLTSRIAYLIEELHVLPQNILAVTFTNKAAKEMKERIVSMIGPYAYGVWISTFHAFGLKVLRSHIEALNLGYKNDFNVIDEDDAKSIVRAAIKELNLDSKVYKVNDLRNKISRFKHFKEDLFKDEQEKNVYHYYKRNLLENNLLDFDDLQVYTLKLFYEVEEIRNLYREQLKYILVDEFQDTDDIQYQILKLLMHGKTTPELFVVGDPDQSIYAFRGANYQNAEYFRRDFGKEHILDVNYRSTEPILAYANKLIAHNSNRTFKKNLSSTKQGLQEPVIITADTDYQESFIISDEINRLTRVEGYKYEDIAVLYRNNALSRIFEDTFIKNSIPYVIYGGMSFYERKEIKDMLAYVRLALNPHLDFYLKRIINVPKRAIGPTTVKKLEELCYQYNISIFQAIDLFEGSGKTKQSLNDFKAIMQDIIGKVNEVKSLAEIINYIGSRSGYIAELEAEKDEVSLDRILNIKELSSVFAEGDNFYEGSTIEKLTQLLDQLSLYTELDKNTSFDSVILSTYHQVKGLEFKIVFMVVMEEEVFPSSRSMFDPRDMEEERRICYVGITRAKERLYLSRAERRMLYGTTNYARPSRFLQEMRPEIRQSSSKERSPYDFMNSKSQERNIHSILEKGDKVEHQAFGRGVVVSVEKEIATIAFSQPHGIKKILESHPSLTKV